MKKTIIAVALAAGFIAAPVMAMSHSNESEDGHSYKHSEESKKHGKGMSELAEKLNLSEDQKALLKQYMKEKRAKYKEMKGKKHESYDRHEKRDHKQMSPEDRKARMAAMAEKCGVALTNDREAMHEAFKKCKGSDERSSMGRGH